jgi:N-acetylmuramoyl-L-alanine amidase
VPIDTRAGSWRTLSVSDARSGAPLTGAVVVLRDSVLALGSPSGAYGFPNPGQWLRVSAPGFRPADVPETGASDVRLTPWFDGVLHGKRFVIDPQGGPNAGVGPMGLSAGHVNLRTALHLEGFLRAAGAEVRLTRTSEEVRLPEDVARLTNRFRADRYLEIRHPGTVLDTSRVLRAYFFPGSAAGEAMARTVGGSAAQRLGVAFNPPGELVTYALQQTACPAIVVAAPSIASGEEEARLERSSYQREQAYAIFVGLLRHYGVADTATLTVEVASATRADWTVTLDGTWTLVTNDDGVATFACVAPGAHDLRLRRGDTTIARGATSSGDSTRVVVDSPH